MITIILIQYFVRVVYFAKINSNIPVLVYLCIVYAWFDLRFINSRPR